VRQFVSNRRFPALGPSLHGKEQLIQRLVEEFPQIFQAAARHATPAYGQDAPPPGQPTASDPDVVVSTEEFKVSISLILQQAPDKLARISWGIFGQFSKG